MERKIGEIFDYNGEWYQCLPERRICDDCAFKNDKTCKNSRGIRGECQRASRQKDGVIFKKLEKVGEPFTSVGKLYQHYKVFEIDNVCGDGFWCVHNYKAKTLTIEIKQTKEDMEEKKIQLKQEDIDYLIRKIRYLVYKSHDYDEVSEEVRKLFIPIKHSNSEKIGKDLKPFSLEAAKAGKPVCTKDGRKARIICFDRRLFYKNVSYPILAVVERSDGEDDVCGYNEKGKVLIEDGAEYKDDLMMLPEKKEGWVNVYRDCDGANITKDDNICSSKEAAMASAQIIDRDNYVATTKINWEE